MAKRGGKWRTETYPGSKLVRLMREAQTGCGAVEVHIDCHGGRSNACFGGVMIGPGKMRQPLRLLRYPQAPLGRIVTRREAMHLGDQMIDEVRRRCGTRAKRTTAAGPLGETMETKGERQAAARRAKAEADRLGARLSEEMYLADRRPHDTIQREIVKTARRRYRRAQEEAERTEEAAQRVLDGPRGQRY